MRVRAQPLRAGAGAPSVVAGCWGFPGFYRSRICPIARTTSLAGPTIRGEHGTELTPTENRRERQRNPPFAFGRSGVIPERWPSQSPSLMEQSAACAPDVAVDFVSTGLGFQRRSSLSWSDSFDGAGLRPWP